MNRARPIGNAAGDRNTRRPAPPPPELTAAPVESRAVAPLSEFIGRIEAIRSSVRAICSM
ncbi:hypothetical protein FZ938_19050 [Azospirillum oryzae]|nr:hypothetical protein FZ938_19050 [Azospirillum oryzae]